MLPAKMIGKDDCLKEQSRNGHPNLSKHGFFDANPRSLTDWSSSRSTGRFLIVCPSGFSGLSKGIINDGVELVMGSETSPSTLCWEPLEGSGDVITKFDGITSKGDKAMARRRMRRISMCILPHIFAPGQLPTGHLSNRCASTPADQ